MTGRREQRPWETLRKRILGPSSVPWGSPGFSGDVQPQKPAGPAQPQLCLPTFVSHPCLHLSLQDLGTGMAWAPSQVRLLGSRGLVFSASLLGPGGRARIF